MKKLAIFDVDGTLFEMPNENWAGDEFNWGNFMEWMSDKPIIQATHGLLRWHAAQGHTVLAISARPEAYRNETVELLNRLDTPFDEIILRDDVLIAAEHKDLQRATNQSEIRQVIFSHHANYRELVCRRIKAAYPDHSFGYAYDDQDKNLEVWKKEAASCWLVDNQGQLSGL